MKADINIGARKLPAPSGPMKRNFHKKTEKRLKDEYPAIGSGILKDTFLTGLNRLNVPFFFLMLQKEFCPPAQYSWKPGRF